MRIVLLLAAAVAFAAAPSAQGLAPAAEPVATAAPAADLLTSEPAPELAPAVDLSEWVAPSTMAAVDVDAQEGAAKDGPSDVVYYGSLAMTAVALGVFASLFF